MRALFDAIDAGKHDVILAISAVLLLAWALSERRVVRRSR